MAIYTSGQLGTSCCDFDFGICKYGDYAGFHNAKINDFNQNQRLIFEGSSGGIVCCSECGSCGGNEQGVYFNYMYANFYKLNKDGVITITQGLPSSYLGENCCCGNFKVNRFYFSKNKLS